MPIVDFNIHIQTKTIMPTAEATEPQTSKLSDPSREAKMRAQLTELVDTPPENLTVKQHQLLQDIGSGTETPGFYRQGDKAQVPGLTRLESEGLQSVKALLKADPAKMTEPEKGLMHGFVGPVAPSSDQTASLPAKTNINRNDMKDFDLKNLIHRHDGMLDPMDNDIRHVSPLSHETELSVETKLSQWQADKTGGKLQWQNGSSTADKLAQPGVATHSFADVQNISATLLANPLAPQGVISAPTQTVQPTLTR